jgi:arylformamidase
MATDATSIANALSRGVFYDVSPPLEEGIPVWPGHPPLVIHKDARNHAQHGYFSQTIVISEHTGAHVDAPAHVAASLMSETIDTVPVDALIGPYKKYDLTGLDLAAGETAGADDLRAAEARDGFGLEPGDIAIMQFGWDRHLKPAGADPEERAWIAGNTPGLSEEACRYLADAGVKAVAADTATCDSAVVDGVILSDPGHKTHFLPRGILIVENLVGLAAAPATGLFIALPLKIAGGSGSPIRAVLVAEEEA